MVGSLLGLRVSLLCYLGSDEDGVEDYDKKRNTLVSGFSRMQRVCGRGGYFRCLRARRIGYGRDCTAQRGRSLVVPRVLARMRTGGAELSCRILEGGVGHC